MLAVFLPALNFRGNRSPYLWWFYKFLSAFGNQAAYVCGEEYFNEPEQLLANGRPEASADVAGHYQYRLPDSQTLARQLRVDIPNHVWVDLEEMFPSNPLEAFKYFCLNVDAQLHAVLVNVLNQIESRAGGIKAVITCVNCATLQQLCREKKLPLIHLELGPLRSPTYLKTAYFDFSGVNGGTESRQRFAIASCDADVPDEWCDIEALRSLFTIEQTMRLSQPEVDLGLGLQIEDDSNIICYSNGYTSLSMLNDAKRLLAERQVRSPVLIRPHPNSLFSVHNLPTGLMLDQSKTSLDFIQRCKQIHTVNSSLAVEALLWEHEAAVYGDCSFAFCIDHETNRCDIPAFSFFLLNYLVPWELAFDPEYIGWRLSRPTEEAIRCKHLEYFMQKKIESLETRIAELEFALSERDQQLAQLKSSLFWRITYPMRAAFYLTSRLINLGRQ